jgi:hypothetical protein
MAAFHGLGSAGWSGNELESVAWKSVEETASGRQDGAAACSSSGQFMSMQSSEANISHLYDD